MELKGIHHISLNISDLNETVDFYTQTLGLKVLKRPDAYISVDGRWLECPDGRQIHLLLKPVPEGKGQHFAFAVANLAEVREELAAKGVQLSKDKTMKDESMAGICVQAFCQDPSGNLVEFNQAL